jgi:hypothetical protein
MIAAYPGIDQIIRRKLPGVFDSHRTMTKLNRAIAVCAGVAICVAAEDSPGPRERVAPDLEVH